tara:strand:+ start:638 stop:880 length:243 start_codon:yes stop_codon:yes gene_type:complete
MGILSDFKIETHKIEFTPATGASYTLTYSNSYADVPTITATCLDVDVNIYVESVTATQAVISSSIVPTTNFNVSVQIIGS